MKEQIKEERFRKIDYKHLISVMITLGFIALGIFVFPNAICRLGESIRDLGTSLGHCFSAEIEATVTDLPSWQIKESKFSSLRLLPFDWSEFKVEFKEYWKAFTSKIMIIGYLYFLADLFFVVFKVVLMIVLVYPMVYQAFKILLSMNASSQAEEDERELRKRDAKESITLQICKRIWDHTYIPVRKFVVDYIEFLKENRIYLKIWLGLWAFYFNFITLVVEFFAYYFYFLKEFDYISVYRFIYKVILDLSVVVRFVPAIVWAVLVVALLEYFAHQYGYGVLGHRERMNRGFFNERSIVFGYDGTMGAGKTLSQMSAGLSCQVELRDRAFEVLVECDFCFPYFPWIKLERELKVAAACHVVYDVPSIRRWMRGKYRKWLQDRCQRRIFGYDFERYGLYHNDKLKIESVWQCLEDYACAYLIYSVQCSLLIANYSVRSDEIIADLGHFPRWNHDFFRRKAKYMDAYSRRAKIVDFDMFRFGKKMLANNPNAHALGFGVYLFTEWDKERKNDLELRSQKTEATADTANQKNDLTNTLLKMIRHAVTIRNRHFIFVIFDLQRAQDWGAAGRDVGELCHIVERGEMKPVLPFWAPFWWFEMFYTLIWSPFVNLYYDYRFVRSDNTAPMHAAKGIVAKVKHIYDGVRNTFNSRRMTIEVESGKMDGVRVRRYQYISSIKDYSERYGTACQEAIFERLAVKNKVGIMDMREYAGKMATDDELRLQHSYFQKDLLEGAEQAEKAA